MENKNINAIDKIIAELSKMDHDAHFRKLTKAQKHNIRMGKKRLSDYGGYSLSGKTIEAIEVKRGYLSGKITEPEYKRFCIEYNLRTVRR